MTFERGDDLLWQGVEEGGGNGETRIASKDRALGRAALRQCSQLRDRLVPTADDDHFLLSPLEAVEPFREVGLGLVHVELYHGRIVNQEDDQHKAEQVVRIQPRAQTPQSKKLRNSCSRNAGSPAESARAVVARKVSRCSRTT